MRNAMSRRWLRLAVLLLALVPAACGKVGKLELPEGESDQFPRQYPSPDEL